MKISAFIALYKTKKSDDEKEKLIKEHIKTEYVPLEKKTSVAEAIVNNSCYETIGKGETETRRFRVNSVAKYMFTCISVLDLYTDIERSTGEGMMLEDFNSLNKMGIFDAIINNINERDLKEFNMVITMVYDDLMTNEYENHAFISKQVERFGTLIGTSLAPVLQTIDLNKIEEIVNNLKQ